MRTQHGFTIIELMIGLLIVAILLGMAAPSYREVVQDNRMTGAVNGFVSSLIAARSESIKRGESITVCKSADGQSCTTSNAWAQGWIGFEDANADGVVDTGEDVLFYHEGLENSLSLDAKNGNAADHITFNSRGFAPGDGDLFVLCDGRGASEARGIVFAASGRAARTFDTDGDGQEDINGTDFTCP